MTVLKVVFLFLATIYGVAIIGRMVYKDGIPTEQVLLFALGFVGFVTLQYNLLEL